MLPFYLEHKRSPYPKSYGPNYERMLGRRFTDLLQNPKARIAPIIDRQKTEKFLLFPTDYGKPWFGQLTAPPQRPAYLPQIEYWMEKYDLSVS